MGIDSYITDPKNHNNAHVVENSANSTNVDRINKNSLVTATHPLKIYENDIRFYTNPLLGADMNIGVEFGPQELIYNEDAGPPTEWDASIISGDTGDWNFDDTGGGGVSPESGSYCIDARGSENNDVMQLQRSSAKDLTNDTAISGYVALTSVLLRNGTKAIHIYGWDTSLSAQVGTTLDIGDYIDPNTLITWQQFTISLSDFNLAGKTIDAIRVRTVDTGGGGPPNYFLDNINLESIGPVSQATFSVEPELGTWLHCYDQTLILARAYDMKVTNLTGDTQNNTGLALAYNNILGLGPLSSGIIYQRVNDGQISQAISLRQLSDVLQFPHTEIQNAIYDGTNTLITVYTKFTEPLILRAENSDRLQYTINDNLSTFLLLRSSIGCKVERRE